MTSTIEQIKQYIAIAPDFPKAGIQFQDISPLLTQPELFAKALELMAAPFKAMTHLAWVGVDARGFIFASGIALQRGDPMLMARKQAKLPPPCLSTDYALEYGTASLEMHPKATNFKQKVVIVDDLLATGGSLQAAYTLCVKAGYDVVGATVLIDLGLCDDFKIANQPVYAVLK